MKTLHNFFLWPVVIVVFVLVLITLLTLWVVSFLAHLLGWSLGVKSKGYYGAIAQLAVLSTLLTRDFERLTKLLK